MKTLRSLLILFAMTMSLVACSFFHSSGQTTINLQSAHYLNPDMNGRASPLVVTVFQLKSPFTFKQASFDQLMGNSSATLGADLIDKETVEIRPNATKQIKFPLDNDTAYVGVVAAYRDISQAKWHTVVKIVPKKHNIIDISLESKGIIVKQNSTGFSL
jgi:type VI secretion system protein VasD